MSEQKTINGVDVGKFSPVLDTVSNRTKVSIEIQEK